MIESYVNIEKLQGNLIVVGKPLSGKTTTIKHIIPRLLVEYSSVLVVDVFEEYVEMSKNINGMKVYGIEDIIQKNNKSILIKDKMLTVLSQSDIIIIDNAGWIEQEYPSVLKNILTYLQKKDTKILAVFQEEPSREIGKFFSQDLKVNWREKRVTNEFMETKEEMIGNILALYDQGRIKHIHNCIVESCNINPYEVKNFLEKELKDRTEYEILIFQDICEKACKYQELQQWLLRNKTAPIKVYG
ncbi:hypothetical protein [Bacillus cereus]|uniref:hypothetical protein n=1 Tax=Bacillus cereus TaxID=1396 RepID=UPI000279156D|nr:hypothetical protein [Bacillus cereus]EJQ01687.1 hypothetical protein IE1_05529 [Bacillus cereus BAG3O-2]